MSRSPDDPLALALRALRRRERSRAELASWLADRGVEDAHIAETVQRLEALGELDDAGFARRYAEDKRELAGWGAERIRAALERRGIAAAEIEAALAAEDSGSEVDRAAALLERRSEPLISERSRARALSFLTRRGYPFEVAYEAVRACERRKAA
jgi:regulatory protein